MLFKYFHQHAEKLYAGCIFLLLIASLWQFSAAFWIQGKAIIAQQLLDYAWNKTIKTAALNQHNITGNRTSREPSYVHKPWPWADTWPVARLSVPRQNVEQIVLAGDSGNSLAFGPGHSFASAKPGTPGTTVISGHRDTHFTFLKNLTINDTVVIQTADNTLDYQVREIKIVDSMSFMLTRHNHRNMLVLVTCYPFDAFTNRSSLRYLVYAEQQQTGKNYPATAM